MKVSTGKVYRCGINYFKIIYRYTTSMGGNYVGVSCSIKGCIDADFTEVSIGLFNSDGKSARHSSAVAQFQLEEV